MKFQPLVKPIQLSTRAACSAGLAVAAAQFLRLEYPLYAMIAAVIVTDLSSVKTQELALQRLAGTVLGAAVGAIACELLSPAAWIIGAAIFAAMFLCHLFSLQGAEKLAGYVCGIVMLDFPGQPWSYAGFRLLETVLGVGIAVLVSYVPKMLKEAMQDPGDTGK
jgi:uncharacterized membrane protein YgaE (UPF0421/DUF939 family)